MDLYKVKYHLIIGTPEEAQKWLQNQWPVEHTFVQPSYNGLFVPLEYDDGSTILALWVKDAVDNLGTLSHEIFHLLCYIMRDKQIRLSQDSEEAWAYLTSFIFDQIWDEYSKDLKKKKGAS